MARVDGCQDDERESEISGRRRRLPTSTDRTQGFSVGINQAMLMTYISEIAPTQVCLFRSHRVQHPADDAQQARGALLANYTIWVSLALTVHLQRNGQD